MIATAGRDRVEAIEVDQDASTSLVARDFGTAGTAVPLFVLALAGPFLSRVLCGGARRTS